MEDLAFVLRHFKVNATAATAKFHYTGVLVDSGATVSLFRDKEFFTKWDESFNSEEFSVTLADGRKRYGFIPDP